MSIWKRAKCSAKSFLSHNSLLSSTIRYPILGCTSVTFLNG